MKKKKMSGWGSSHVSCIHLSLGKQFDILVMEGEPAVALQLPLLLSEPFQLLVLSLRREKVPIEVRYRFHNCFLARSMGSNLGILDEEG